MYTLKIKDEKFKYTLIEALDHYIEFVATQLRDKRGLDVDTKGAYTMTAERAAELALTLVDLPVEPDPQAKNYKIEIDPNPCKQSPTAPYFWCLLKWHNDQWVNDGFGWEATPRLAFNSANNLYIARTIKK